MYKKKEIVGGGILRIVWDFATMSKNRQKNRTKPRETQPKKIIKKLKKL